MIRYNVVTMFICTRQSWLRYKLKTMNFDSIKIRKSILLLHGNKHIFIPTTKYLFEDHISKYYKISFLLIFYFYKNKTPFPKTMCTQENDHYIYEQTDLTGCMRAVEPVTNSFIISPSPPEHWVFGTTFIIWI